MLTSSQIIGTVALVFYVFPYLGIIFVPLGILYYTAAVYYRRTSVETKRLDSLMRSALYAAFSGIYLSSCLDNILLFTETLTGLSTLRAYREGPASIRNADSGLNMENRAYYMTISIQRWLAIRLDFFGNVLLFGIAVFAAGFRKTVDPSKIGVVLSYALGSMCFFYVVVFALNSF